MTIIQGLMYKNVTTGIQVRVLDVFESTSFGMATVAYFNSAKVKDFLKPLYIFEKTYVKILK